MYQLCLLWAGSKSTGDSSSAGSTRTGDFSLPPVPPLVSPSPQDQGKHHTSPTPGPRKALARSPSACPEPFPSSPAFQLPSHGRWEGNVSWDRPNRPFIFPISPLRNKLGNLSQPVSGDSGPDSHSRVCKVTLSLLGTGGEFIQLLRSPGSAKFLIPVAEDKRVPRRGAQVWTGIGFQLSST